MKKIAYITGGTGSIGAAVVKTLVRDGLEVRFQYFNNQKKAVELEKELGAKGYQYDLRSKEFLGFENVDILVNSAGVILTTTKLHEVSDEELEETLDVNVIAPFLLIRAVLPHMIRSRWGRIINVGSIYSRSGTSKNSSYNVSKHALLGLTRSVSRDYAELGITANQVDPSAVDSKIIDNIAERYSKSEGISKEQYKSNIADFIPVKRLATPYDIAEMISFLASEKASFITGESIAVDGGVLG